MICYQPSKIPFWVNKQRCLGLSMSLITDWMKDYLRPPTHHTEPHAYKFEINEEGDVWFKRFCMDPEWNELRPILPQVPDGTPSLIRFDWKKQCPIDEIRDKIKTCEVKFSQREIDWWASFLKELKTTQS